MKKERIKHFIYFLILVILDQGTKLWAKATLQGQQPIQIIPKALKLQYHENNGAVWGIMSGKVTFLILITLLILALLTYVYLKIPNNRKLYPLKLIFVFIAAGAIGNFIDRVYLQYVIDFIYFELINFPIFNVADSYVSVASVLLLVLAIFYYKDEDFSFIDELFSLKKNKKKNENENDD